MEMNNWILLAIAALNALTAYLAFRTKESLQEVGENVITLEKNTNSISERNQAIAMKLGITEGIAQERASVQANAPAIIEAAAAPLPVSDEKTAAAVEKVVDAIQEQTKEIK